MIRVLIILLFVCACLSASGQIYTRYLPVSTAAAPGEITSPADLNVLAWHEADTLVFDTSGSLASDNDLIGEWSDLSGNGYDLTPWSTDWPQYSITEPQIESLSAGESLQNSGLQVDSTQATTLIVIVATNSGTTALPFIQSSTLSTTEMYVGLARQQFSIRGSVATLTHTFGSLNSLPTLYYAVFNGANSKIYVNTSLSTSGNIGQHKIDGWNVMRATSSGANAFVQFLLLVEGELSADELGELYTNYIEPKYGTF